MFTFVSTLIPRNFLRVALVIIALINVGCYILPLREVDDISGPLYEDKISFSPPNHSNPYLNFSKSDCDPYLQPGFLTNDVPDIDRIFWNSFNPNCSRAPHFLRDVIERKALPWLQGKTLLLVGDSVERNNLQFFCEMVSGSLIARAFDNLVVTTSNGSHYIAPTEETRLLICRVEEYDFEIVTYPHWGLQEADVFAQGRERPRQLEERIPFVKTIFESYERKPDMLLLASGLWDLGGWATLDAFKAAPIQNGIEGDRWMRWMERAEKFVDIMESSFPNTCTFWRMLHPCKVDWGIWFLVNAPDEVDKTPRAPFHDLRIFQMNNAYKQLLIRRPQLYQLSWGELLTGHKESYLDSIHPWKDAAVLWGDMMLYYISRLKI